MAVEKMVTVKVITPYKDMEKMVLFYEGETHEVTEKRAAELVNKKLVEVCKAEK